MAGFSGLIASMRGAAESRNQAGADIVQAIFTHTPVAETMEQQVKLMIRAMI